VRRVGMICSGVWRLRFMGLLLAKSGRWGSSHKGWFSFWGPRQGHAHGGHDHAGHQIDSDHIVSGLLSDRPGQDWDLLAGAQPPPGRQIRHGLAAAQQDSAGDG
jgi:hypothetical protein